MYGSQNAELKNPNHPEAHLKVLSKPQRCKDHFVLLHHAMCCRWLLKPFSCWRLLTRSGFSNIFGWGNPKLPPPKVKEVNSRPDIRDYTFIIIIVNNNIILCSKYARIPTGAEAFYLPCAQALCTRARVIWTLRLTTAMHACNRPPLPDFLCDNEVREALECARKLRICPKVYRYVNLSASAKLHYLIV